MIENTEYDHPEALVDAEWVQAHLSDPIDRSGRRYQRPPAGTYPLGRRLQLPIGLSAISHQQVGWQKCQIQCPTRRK